MNFVNDHYYYSKFEEFEEWELIHFQKEISKFLLPFLNDDEKIKILKDKFTNDIKSSFPDMSNWEIMKFKNGKFLVCWVWEEIYLFNIIGLICITKRRISKI